VRTGNVNRCFVCDAGQQRVLRLDGRTPGISNLTSGGAHEALPLESFLVHIGAMGVTGRQTIGNQNGSQKKDV